MKYISRITALLLVLMMLTPTFASALTLGTATQGDLDRLYQEATDSGYEYYPTGYLGFWGEVDAFDTLTNKDAYTFQWYDAEGNALQSYGEDAPEKLRFVYTMETQYFHCVATRVSDGATMTSAIKVIPPADISNPEDYLGFLYDPSIFLDVFGAADTLTIYHMMIDTWNVTMPNGMNLAESILELWWSEREESYFDPYLLCSCVVSGAVASDECVLHPNSDLHVNGCSWKQPEISANVDVSTPESLLMLENVVLAAEERPDVDAYAWQNYVYDPEIAGMRWAVVEYVQDTNLYTIQINKESIQTAYRVVIETTDYNVFESKPLYLGGYDFFNWILTTDGIQEWMADESVTLADVVARYNNAADEEDRTNAEDYTYGEEGESVNLKVPQGTFAEDYVMEFAEIAAGRVEQLQKAVMAQMDATGTHVAQVLMALDISFASLANSAKKLQPNAPVTLTFQVDTTGLDEALKYLYVYHIANDGTPEVVAGPIEATFSVQPIEVQGNSFSEYLVMATSDYCPYCQNFDGDCFYAELADMTQNQQYEYLQTLNGNYATLMMDYVRHVNAGAPAILCTCVDYANGDRPKAAPLDSSHGTECPWSDDALQWVGILGTQATLSPGEYPEYKWFKGNTNGDPISTAAVIYPTFEKEAQRYICQVKDKNGVQHEFWYRVQADMSMIVDYLSYIDTYYLNQDDLSFDRYAIYDLMTTTWNVPIKDTADDTLTKAILVYWKYNFTPDLEEGMFCSCCIGEDNIVSDQIMLHPDALHDETCPWYTEVEVIIPPIPEQPPLYNGNPNGAQYTSNETYSLPMANDRAVILPKGGRAIIKSNQASGAQWQVSDGTQWIDIQGETAADIYVTDAKLNSIFELTGIAQLRYFDKTNNTVLASVSVTSKEIANGEYPEEEEITTFSLMPRAEGDEQAETYSIVINYVFENDEIAADPYTATLAPGSGLTKTVPHPIIKGYLPYIGEATETSDGIDLDIQNIQADVTYTVVYKPTNVSYSVIYYLQNVDNDDYTPDATVVKQGLTGSQVPVMDKTYAGFYQLDYARPEIAADDSTVVEVYYDREYYLMLFELSGGYGVEPIYARYDASVGTIANPTRLGYTFNGWSPAIPSNVPRNGGTYTAQWTPKNTTYTVIYWQENANDSNYSFYESETVTALSGSKVSGSNTKTYTGFHYDHADSNVTVEGDGSTIVNVYYKRNTYTLTFAYQGGPLICDVHIHSNACKTLTCTRTEHRHSDSCCEHGGTSWSHWGHSDNCCTLNLSEHTHSNNCYSSNYVCGLTGSTSHSHSVENGCYGMKFEGIKYGQDTSYWWNQAPAYRWKTTYSGSIAYTYAPAMPNGNLTVYGETLGSSYQYLIHYYEENTTNKVHEDNLYYRGGNGYSLTDEDYIKIPGFSCLQSGSMKPSWENGIGVYRIYYRRLSYTITFNNGSEVKKTNPYLYEADISGAYYKPTYTGDNPDAYEFGGWYTTEDCLNGTEFNFTGAKMPYNNLLLYAKWVPITRTVDFYLTPEDMNAGKTYRDTVEVPNGTKLSDEVLKSIEEPDRGDYDFVGWFYLEDGVEQAFDFKNMTVTQNLRVFGKWSSKVLKEYTVHFKIKDTDTKVADTIVGSTLAGMSRTFEAKGGEALYTSYREGYFPLTKSHTITLDIDDNSKNTFTFWYVQKDAVPYTVYYVAETLKAGGTSLGTIEREGKTYYIIADPYTNSTNRKAVVTEKFKTVSGYMPDAYQKRLVVDGTEGAGNEIIFYYEVDTQHAYYKITHYKQNTDGQTWTEHSSTELIGDINATYSATPITIEGFSFDDDNALNVLSGTLTADGLELKLYYTRNTYPYEVRYLEQGSLKELHAPKSGTGLYNAVVSEEAISIPGYDLVSDTPQNITIKIDVDATLEDGTELKAPWRNIITFYYAESEATINYVVVGPDGCGSVNPTSENVKVVTGETKGSAAAAASNYHFVGWYQDEACTIPADTVGTVNGTHFKPSRPGELWQNDSFYAKFEEDQVVINYKVVCPAGAEDFCTVSPESETIGVVTGNPSGSTATATSKIYKFVGWYDNPACEGEALTIDAKYVPEKVNGLNVAATYYAKFVYDVGHLSITKIVDNSTGFTPTQKTFTFTVKLTGENLNDAYEVKKKDGTVVESTWTQNGNDRTGTFTLTATEITPATVVIEGILNGTAYTVAETPVTGYKTESTNASGSIRAGSTVTAAFTNTYSVGSLTLTKTVQGADAPKDKDGNFTDEFTFTLKVEGFAGLKVEVKGTEEKLNASGETTFTMKDGETVIINGIPDDAKYTVTEMTDNDYKTTVNGEDNYAVSGTMDAGAVDAAKAAFVNTYRYSHLTVEKKGMEEGESAIFEVKAKSKYNNDQELTFTITVPNGKSVTIGELLIGSDSTYTITEIGRWSNRYAAVSVPSGTIVEGGTTVTVTNGDKNQQWLHGEDYVHNDFSKPGTYGN